MRPSWDSYFMKIAEDVALRSTCDRAMVGAVLVREKHIISTGYNGSPAGLEHCDDIGHLSGERALQHNVDAEGLIGQRTRDRNLLTQIIGTGVHRRDQPQTARI